MPPVSPSSDALDMAIHRHIDDELKKLYALLTQMFDRVAIQLTHAIEAVVSDNEDLAQRVRLGDDEVDSLEIKIDHQCEVLLATQQPVAVDMRMLVTAIKVNTDLERIGDHSANIAKHVPFLSSIPSFVYEHVRTEELAHQARRILLKTRAAFLTQNKDAAHEILPLDEEVDLLYKKAFAKIIELGGAHPEYAEGLAYLLIVTKSLERIGDHAMNIAEAVIFQVDGVDIRHQRNHKA